MGDCVLPWISSFESIMGSVFTDESRISCYVLSSMTEERSLIEQAQAGDSTAFETLLSLNYDKIYRTARRLAWDDAEAEDITQEALLKISRSIRSFKFQAQFSTWLYQVTINVARDYARRMKRIQLAKQEMAGTLLTEEPAHESSQRVAAIQEALKQLNEKERVIVVLSYYEGLGHGEIGKIIGCAETTVSWHMFMAKKKLKKLLCGGTHG